MKRGTIKKTFALDSEPVLNCPQCPVDRFQLKGVQLNYSGRGMKYRLIPSKGDAVDMVGWKVGKRFTVWRNVFSHPDLQPAGLRSLAELHKIPGTRAVCDWASQYGLLGFEPINNHAKPGGFFNPIYVGDQSFYHYEPLACIRNAAQRAENVIRLWTGLKESYVMRAAQETIQAIRSVLTIKEDIEDSSYVDFCYKPRRQPTPSTFSEFMQTPEFNPTKLRFRVLVNGERRSQWPIPKNLRGWRRLATVMLGEYIQEHIEDQIGLSLKTQLQYLEVEINGGRELPSDWNLKPSWRISSALAAYYVELLMVMRQFRSCKTCGKDISHQKAKSVYCGDTSSCRSKNWHRQKAARRKSSRAAQF